MDNIKSSTHCFIVLTISTFSFFNSIPLDSILYEAIKLSVKILSRFPPLFIVPISLRMSSFKLSL